LLLLCRFKSTVKEEIMVTAAQSIFYSGVHAVGQSVENIKKMSTGERLRLGQHVAITTVAVGAIGFNASAGIVSGLITTFILTGGERPRDEKMTSMEQAKERLMPEIKKGSKAEWKAFLFPAGTSAEAAQSVTGLSRVPTQVEGEKKSQASGNQPTGEGDSKARKWSVEDVTNRVRTHFAQCWTNIKHMESTDQIRNMIKIAANVLLVAIFGGILAGAVAGLLTTSILTSGVRPYRKSEWMAAEGLNTWLSNLGKNHQDSQVILVENSLVEASKA
jgi:hypothetical protein